MKRTFVPLFAALWLAACAGTATDSMHVEPDPTPVEVATFGAGCFWCAEACLEQLDGVVDVRSGFMGGEELEDATADELAAAGHAEVVQVHFDPARLAYDDLLAWFWIIHDPTSVDKQGADEGPEYRSVIFAHSRDQRASAIASRDRLEGSVWRPIQTQIVDASRFYPASEEHQNYYSKNRGSKYCQGVIAPHLEGVGLKK